MANHKSAAKRARQELKIGARNSQTKSAVRSVEKQLRAAITSKKPKEAQELLIAYSSKMGKATQKGIYHLRTAGRKISRLSSQVNTMK